MTIDIMKRAETIAVELGAGIEAEVPLMDFAGVQTSLGDSAVSISMLFNCPRPINTDFIHTIKVDAFGVREYGPELLVISTGLGIEALHDAVFDTEEDTVALIQDMVNVINSEAPSLFVSEISQ